MDTKLWVRFLAHHDRALDHEYDCTVGYPLNRTGLARAANGIGDWAHNQRENYGGIGAGHCCVIAHVKLPEGQRFLDSDVEHVDITSVLPDCDGLRRASAEDVERVRAFVLDQLAPEDEQEPAAAESE